MLQAANPVKVIRMSSQLGHSCQGGEIMYNGLSAQSEDMVTHTSNTVNHILFQDCPCGDMTWMPVFLRNRSDVEYTGYDLIPQNIENNIRKFENESWTFKQFDMIKNRIGR